MRAALGTFASAALLILSAVLDVVGSWAMPAGAVLMLIGAVIGAIAMEERDLRTDERLLETL